MSSEKVEEVPFSHYFNVKLFICLKIITKKNKFKNSDI
ncbi:hypothetical protein CSCA_3259 [Clostridium scatologenes]|uniref:Uncharacterized protein n=1 Tax=Clostridium scatologenes TaxID=1548 RepID=A0A0E3M7I3_CLOSL|nr:hypothetical protein CSCA_3259 [Clostridium scatologenes]